MPSIILNVPPHNILTFLFPDHIDVENMLKRGTSAAEFVNWIRDMFRQLTTKVRVHIFQVVFLPQIVQFCSQPFSVLTNSILPQLTHFPEFLSQNSTAKGDGMSNTEAQCSQFLLTWSFVSKIILRELTENEAPTLGI